MDIVIELWKDPIKIISKFVPRNLHFHLHDFTILHISMKTKMTLKASILC